MPKPFTIPHTTNGRIKSPYRITPALLPLAVPVANLVLDPVNARLHPERNMQAVKESLISYGQVKPIVVRKETNVVVAGNGTLMAAKALGWDQIAAVVIEMTDVEAAGYGLADNRTAELAKWDFEVVARIDKMLQEHGHTAEGWTDDELAFLRGQEFTEPEQDDGMGKGSGEDESTTGEQTQDDNTTPAIPLSPEDYETVSTTISRVRDMYELDSDVTDSTILSFICSNWLERLEAENADPIG